MGKHEVAPEPNTRAAVSVESLVKRYGAVAAVDRLSLEIGAGEIFALLGPNGAGKTTTIEILEGYRSADEGRVRVLGLDPHRQPSSLRRRVGVMLQDGGLYPGIKVSEAVRLFASYYQDPLDPDTLIEEMGLGQRRSSYVRRLSAGERQRLSMALALVGKPELVFLDEPTAGMDPRGRAGTWEKIRELRDRGTTVVLTTHLLDEAERLAGRVAIIDRGKLVALGSPSSIAGPSHGIEFGAASEFDRDELSDALGSSVLIKSQGVYVVEAKPSPELIAALASHLAARNVLITKLYAGQGSLEEVFLRLTDER